MSKIAEDLLMIMSQFYQEALTKKGIPYQPSQRLIILRDAIHGITIGRISKLYENTFTFPFSSDVRDAKVIRIESNPLNASIYPCTISISRTLERYTVTALAFVIAREFWYSQNGGHPPKELIERESELSTERRLKAEAFARDFVASHDEYNIEDLNWYLEHERVDEPIDLGEAPPPYTPAAIAHSRRGKVHPEGVDSTRQAQGCKSKCIIL